MYFKTKVWFKGRRQTINLILKLVKIKNLKTSYK